MDAASSVYEYLDYRAFVRDAIELRKESNPHYSIRGLAQRIGCNPGNFVKVLKGERNLTGEFVLQLGEALKLSKKEQRYFELLVNFNQAQKQVEREHYLEQLQSARGARPRQVTPDQHILYTRWFYVVLRELLNIVKCRDLSSQTCRELGKLLYPAVPGESVREALTSMEAMGIIKRSASDHYVLDEKIVTSGTGLPPVIVNRILLEFIELARRAVDGVPREQRKLSTLTVSASAQAVDKIRERLDSCRTDILSIIQADRGTLDRVYHINLHLFPVTRSCAEGSS